MVGRKVEWAVCVEGVWGMVIEPKGHLFWVEFKTLVEDVSKQLKLR